MLPEALVDLVEAVEPVVLIMLALVAAMELLEEEARVETLVDLVKAQPLENLEKTLEIYILAAEAADVALVLPAPEVLEAAHMEVVRPLAVLLLPILAAVVEAVEKELLLVAVVALVSSLFVI